jgi:hypothetical protein
MNMQMAILIAAVIAPISFCWAQRFFSRDATIKRARRREIRQRNRERDWRRTQ